MIDVISVSNMRDSDAYTVDNMIPASELMRRAAQGIFLAGAPWCGKTVVVTGSGNNGGDGYALAWILQSYHFDVEILTLSDHCTPTASIYRQHCEEIGVPISSFRGEIIADTVVDCLLGTGFSGEVRENHKVAIEAINNSGARVISADINSGMDGDTGKYQHCVKSDLTVTIGYIKKGMLTPTAQSMIGRLAVADIGIKLMHTEDSIDETAYGIDIIKSVD